MTEWLHFLVVSGWAWAIYLMAYLIGSIPFAVVSSKIFGLQDPREYGSKNPGATNVLRSGNKQAALLTLVGDGFKGWLVVWLAQQNHLSGIHLAVILLAVFVGHCASIFLKFKGGKGVATAIGIWLGLSPLLGGAAVLSWLLIAFVTRYSSLSALLTACWIPFGFALMTGTWDWVFWALLLVSAGLIARHKSNIQKLLAGQEKQIGR